MLNPEHSFTQTAEWCSWAMNHQENAVEDKPRCWTTGRGTFKQSCLWGLAESKLAVIDSSPNEQTLSLFPNLTSALLWLITCLLFKISAGLWVEKTNTHHWKKNTLHSPCYHYLSDCAVLLISIVGKESLKDYKCVCVWLCCVQ